jgi:hypothetical protein
MIPQILDVVQGERNWYQAQITPIHTEVYWRNYALLMKNIFFNDYDHHVAQYLENLITNSEDRKKLFHHAEYSSNTLQTIISQISTVYGSGVVRTFSENKETENLYKQLDVNAFMESVNTFMNLFGKVLIFVDFDLEKQVPVLRLLHRGNCIVKTRPGFKNQIQAVAYEIDRENAKFTTEKDWVVWTEKEHYVIKNGGDYPLDFLNMKKWAVPGNEKMANPYGKLLFIQVCVKQETDRFWPDNTMSPAAEATLSETVKKMQTNNRIFWNQALMLAVYGASELPSNLQFGMNKVFDFRQGTGNQNPQAEVLSFEGNLQPVLDVIDRIRMDISRQFGIDLSSVNAVQAKSGTAISLENSTINAIIEKQKPVFIRAEQQLYEMLKYVCEVRRVNVFKDTDEFSIEFPTTQAFESAEAEAKFYWSQVQTCAMSLPAYVMRVNKSIKTEEEAKKYIRDNKEFFETIFEPTKFNLGTFGQV